MIKDFLIEQIEIDSKSIEYLLDVWVEPRSETQNRILNIVLGKCYGYLNTLKELIKHDK